MESYPTDYILHLPPLVIVQGLGDTVEEIAPRGNLKEKESLENNALLQDTEPLFRKQHTLSDIPFISDVLKVWGKYHVDELIWDSSSMKSQISTYPYRYKFRFVDNDYALPKLKEKATTSILSPQNTNSKLYPEGIFTVDWLQKYKSIVPSSFISFYELDGALTEPEEIEKVDQELASEINKLRTQLLSRGIKLLALIVCSRSNVLNPELDERVLSIRKQTGLNSRSGLLFLSSSTPKAVNDFAQDVMQMVKSLTLEFYSNTEKKLRKKRIKTLGSIENNSLLKNRIEARYALKLGFINEFKQQYDYSIRSFETAYENLIDIFDTLPVTDPNWNQFRLLLDITLFHIIKLNLYLELVNVSYKKFDVHIQSVIYFLKQKNISPKSYSICNWLYIQFKWLAQLSDLGPSSLIPSSVPFVSDEQDSLSPLVLPHSGYLYLQALHLLKRREKAKSSAQVDNMDTYLLANGSETHKNDEILNLLNFSKLAFQKQDNNLFERSVASVNYQIAEEYFNMDNFEKAFKFYEQSMEVIKDDNWNYLSKIIFFKLLVCCFKLKRHYAFTMNLIELSLLPAEEIDDELKKYIKKLCDDSFHSEDSTSDINKGILAINLSTDDSFDIFQSEVLFKHPKTNLTELSSFQIKIKSLFNDLLDDIIVEELSISFEGSLPSVLLKHNSNASLEVNDLSLDSEKECLVGETNLSFGKSKEKYLHLAIPTKTIGINKCISISATLKYQNMFQIRFNIPIKMSKLNRYHIWRDENGIEKVIGSNDPTLTEVIPRVPDIKVNIESIDKFAIPGEHFRLKVKIKNSDREPIDLTLGSEVIYSNEKVSSSWNETGSDELLLANLEKEKILLEQLQFTVPPLAEDDALISIKLDITYYVGGDHEVPIKDALNVKVPVLDPFKISISFFPRIREENLPAAFVMRPDEDPYISPLRFWLTKTNIVNEFNSEIEVIDNYVTFSTANQHMICREIQDLTNTITQGNVTQTDHYIETTIKDDHIYRNMLIEAVLYVRWKRPNSDSVHEYQNSPWSLSLPLLDPRVLLDVKFTDDNNDLKLIYMIENPTSRIFSFSYSITENQNFQITGTKAQNVTVLPCTRQKIIFHAVPLAAGWLGLPQLKVYDLQYKVNLPTLLATADAQTNKHEIYVNIPQW